MIGMKRKRNAFWAFLIPAAILWAACGPARGVEPAISNDDSAVTFAEDQVEDSIPSETEDEDESSAEEAVEAEFVEETATVSPTDVEVFASDKSSVDESNDEAGDDETGVTVENADEPAVEDQATQTPEAMDEDGIFLTDDRPDNLRFVTEGWNTNWQRHSIEYGELLSGGPPRDGIRSLDDPTFVSIEEAAAWLVGNEPVIALEIAGDARAYPLQILTWHEIANDVVGEVPVMVTFCPLCNSALVFDRRLDGETYEFGTSGLLRNSDLVMYDRTTESLWQQLTGEGIAGDLTGEHLTFLASSLVSFDDFKDAFPEGVVLSQATGFERAYGINPYAGYDTYENPLSADGNIMLLKQEQDGRLPAAERVVTVSLADAEVDVAYPLTVLSEVSVINDRQGGQDLAIFYAPGTSSALGDQIIASAEDVGATGVFDPNLEGQKLKFSHENEAIVDNETGSIWNILGQATNGPLAGKSLRPIVHGDHFWFSWAAFKPDTIIYQS
jgi:hypothetical protein